MRIAIIAITRGGKELARKLAEPLPATFLETKEPVKEKMKENWSNFDGFICIMATGIVVRSIAPLLKNKKTDPAIVVLDEKGQNVISLLSGHLGGGNELACRVAELTGGKAVITTASDTLKLPPLDLWCRSQNFFIQDTNQLTRASSKLVNNGHVIVYSEVKLSDLPKEFILTKDPEKADIIISINNFDCKEKLVLHPKIVVAGMGCKRGTPVAEFKEALQQLCGDLRISIESICKISSIDKKSDEEGMLEFAKQMDLPITFFTKDEINVFSNLAMSDAAMKAVGAIGVAEPCALLGADTRDIQNLISKKRKWKNITIALAMASSTL